MDKASGRQSSFGYPDVEFRPKPELDSTCTIVMLEWGNDVIPTPRWEGRDDRTSSASLTGIPKRSRVADSGEMVTQKQRTMHCFWVTTYVENCELLRCSIFDMYRARNSTSCLRRTSQHQSRIKFDLISRFPSSPMVCGVLCLNTLSKRLKIDDHR